VYDAIAGFGPLQQHLDDDPSIEEIWINERLTDGYRDVGRKAPIGHRTWIRAACPLERASRLSRVTRMQSSASARAM